MPGAAACTGEPCRMTSAVAASAVQIVLVNWLTDIVLSNAGLGGRVDAAANVDFGHQATEGLRVIRPVIEMRGVEVVGVPSRVLRDQNAGLSEPLAFIQNAVQGLTAGERAGIRGVVQVHSGLIAEQ